MKANRSTTNSAVSFSIGLDFPWRPNLESAWKDWLRLSLDSASEDRCRGAAPHGFTNIGRYRGGWLLGLQPKNWLQKNPEPAAKDERKDANSKRLLGYKPQMAVKRLAGTRR